MYATLTSKGQITLPKEIRDRLGLAAGSMLDFAVLPDNSISARPVTPDARRIRGILKSPYVKALSIKQMDQAVASSVKQTRCRSRANGNPEAQPAGCPPARA